jgi:hypothetical protein
VVKRIFMVLPVLVLLFFSACYQGAEGTRDTVPVTEDLQTTEQPLQELEEEVPSVEKVEKARLDEVPPENEIRGNTVPGSERTVDPGGDNALLEPLEVDRPGVFVIGPEGTLDNHGAEADITSGLEMDRVEGFSIDEPLDTLSRGVVVMKGVTGTPSRAFDGYESYLSYPGYLADGLEYEGSLEVLFSISSFRPYAGILHLGEMIDWSDESWSLQFGERPSDGLRFTMVSESGEVFVLEGGEAAEPGEWYHVVVRWDRDDVSIHVNGRRVASMVNACFPFRASTGRLQVGSQVMELYDEDRGTLAMDGCIDEAFLYRRALEEREIRARWLELLGSRKEEKAFHSMWETPVMLAIPLFLMGTGLAAFRRRQGSS